ncbi:MAG: ABC transporter permease, partial [Bryobacteraceae bacterium]
MNIALLRPLPYPEPERLAQLIRTYPNDYGSAVTATQFVYCREHNHAFEHVAAYSIFGSGFNLTGTAEPERLPGISVTAGFFSTLGVAPRIGRDFLPAEGRTGAKLAMLSNNLWRRRFGADPGVVGKTIRLSGESYTVAGVMPRGFRTTPAADIWNLMRLTADPGDRANVYLMLGRMKPGVSIEQANADLKVLTGDFRRAYPNLIDKSASFGAEEYQKFLALDIRPALLMLLGAVSIVLLIACANVANLLLARAAGRSREIAIRSALGAGRGRLVRQLLTESVLLGMAGGALGLALAAGALRAFTTLPLGGVADLTAVSIDGRVLAFTLVVSLATSVLFGLVPAWQASR